MEICIFIATNAFYGEKKSACGVRTSLKNKKNYKKMIITLKNAFYGEKKSACGARTGFKNKKIAKNWLLQQKTHFIKKKKAPAARALASTKKLNL